MVRAKGGKVWHKKDKEGGVVQKGLTGLDKEATWGRSNADGWIYGHGTFCLTSHDKTVVGLFSGCLIRDTRGKRLGEEISEFADFLDVVCIDSKADDEKMYSNLKAEYGIKLLTVPRKDMDKSEARQKLIAEQMTVENRVIYKQRGITVEPMQGVIKNIFSLEAVCIQFSQN